MKSKNELKETAIKNCVCYYFDDIIHGTGINLSNILLDKKLYEHISVYLISYKIQTGQKPLHIRFDKTDGFIIPIDGKIKFDGNIKIDYELINKICEKINLILQMVWIIILERSKLIHIILHRLKIWFDFS